MADLLTFGPLELPAVPFRREKPLLLLAYLSLRGPQERRALARLFWPDATDPMNSLSVALGQLRRASGTLFHATDTHVSTALTCDVPELLHACTAADLGTARSLYRGAFAATLQTADLSDDLAEWVTATRERCADAYRSVLLRQARAAANTDPSGAGPWAALAYAVAGAAPPTPALYRELHALLSAAGHADAALLERDAAALDVPLSAPAPPLPGRHAELQRLTQVQPGETVWVRGPAGIGKSALLHAAAPGRVQRGQTGQAYATLLSLPDLPHPAPADERGWLRHLSTRRDPLFLDDWEASDPDSRRALLALAATRSGPPLTIASRERPPLPLPELVLRPLDTLRDGELDATGGIPALLHAHRAGSPLADAYAPLLAPHPPRARQLLACLGIQPDPDLKATQAALEVSADDMAAALERLRRACLLDGTQPTAPAALRAWLDTQPSLETEVLTLLAPHLSAPDALPLYLRAHTLTGSSDFPGFQDTLATRARTLLTEGRESESAALLEQHGNSVENALLRARALNLLGRHDTALTLLDGFHRSAEVEAIRARALLRLGRIAEAEEAVGKALQGNMETRAAAFELRGTLALATQKYAQAADDYERAAGLFLMLGDDVEQLKARCTRALALSHMDVDVTGHMHELLALAEHTPHPLTFVNLSWLHDRLGDAPMALTLAQRAAELAQQRQLASYASVAWNNAGAILQKQGRAADAERAYRQAIAQAQGTGDPRLLALALGNLAELNQSVPLLDEVIELLSSAGQADLVAYFTEQRDAFRGRSGGP